MADVITIGGVDRSANLAWDSLKIEQVAGEFTAVCSLKLNDPNAAIAIAAKDTITIVDGADTLFAGEVADVDWELLSTALDGRRIVLACQDYGILVEEAVIDAEEAYSAEADSAIIDDLFTTYRPDIDSTTFVSTLDASMDLTVENVTLRQALVELCKLTEGRWYVDEDKCLHYFAAEANVAAWFLSDTPDLATSFPYQSIKYRSAGGTIVNQVLVIGTGMSGWREDAGSVFAYGERPAVVVDTSIGRVPELNARGDAILAKWSEPRMTYEVTTRKTGLRAGMDVRLVCGAWAVDETLTVRRLRLRWKDDQRFYDLELGDLVVNALEGGRTITDRLDQVAGDTTDLGATVFDEDAPGAPAFNAGNLSTGTMINNDGTELVWIVTTWGIVGDGDLDHYEVQLSTANDFSANVLTRHHPGDGPRIERWEGLTGNVTYYCRVRAVDWVGNASAWVSANIVSATDGSAPGAPTNVTAVATPTSVHLSWTAVAAADLAGYDVQRKPDGGAYATISTRHGGTLFIDNKVTPGQAYWYKVRATDFSNNSSAYVEIAGAVTPAKVGSIDTVLALQGWSHNLVFSATDHDTVAWASGMIRLSNGTTYNITGANTGNMAAVTYIYLDIAVSTTLLQTTTTASTAAGDNKILVAVAQNVAAGKKAIFQVFGGAGQGVLVVADNIAANTITANEIAANTITAGQIAAATITGTQIAATTITAANIQALTIGAGQLAADAVTADKILANAVTAIKINAGAVTTAKLDAGAVTVEKLNVVVGGYNLLINSGMNDDDDGDGVPDEWTGSSTITNGSHTLDATYKVVGASSFARRRPDGLDHGHDRQRDHRRQPRPGPGCQRQGVVGQARQRARDVGRGRGRQPAGGLVCQRGERGGDRCWGQRPLAERRWDRD